MEGQMPDALRQDSERGSPPTPARSPFGSGASVHDPRFGDRPGLRSPAPPSPGNVGYPGGGRHVHHLELFGPLTQDAEEDSVFRKGGLSGLPACFPERAQGGGRGGIPEEGVADGVEGRVVQVSHGGTSGFGEMWSTGPCSRAPPWSPGRRPSIARWDGRKPAASGGHERPGGEP